MSQGFRNCWIRDLHPSGFRARLYSLLQQRYGLSLYKLRDGLCIRCEFPPTDDSPAIPGSRPQSNCRDEKQRAVQGRCAPPEPRPWSLHVTAGPTHSTRPGPGLPHSGPGPQRQRPAGRARGTHRPWRAVRAQNGRCGSRNRAAFRRQGEVDVREAAPRATGCSGARTDATEARPCGLLPAHRSRADFKRHPPPPPCDPGQVPFPAGPVSLIANEVLAGSRDTESSTRSHQRRRRWGPLGPPAQTASSSRLCRVCTTPDAPRKCLQMSSGSARAATAGAWRGAVGSPRAGGGESLPVRLRAAAAAPAQTAGRQPGSP